MAAPRPSPAVQCLQKPGALPTGPGAAAPALRSAAALPGAGPAWLGAGTAAAGLATGGAGAASASGGAGLLAAVAAAAGLAIGGMVMASTMPSTPTPDAAPLARATADVHDTMRMFRLAEAIPGFASTELPMNLTLLDQPRSSASAEVPGMGPNDRPAGPETQEPDTTVSNEAAPVNIPEPASIALLSLGGLGALLTRRWRQRQPMPTL